MPEWIVQTPAASGELIRARRSAEPIPPAMGVRMHVHRVFDDPCIPAPVGHWHGSDPAQYLARLVDGDVRVLG
jgi:hypothetical protein